jgi:quercetin dioxygenase-like cupin family protein
MKLGASISDKPGFEQSEAVKVTSVTLVCFAPGFFEDWHNAHARRYVITLTGRGEVELGGGQKITLEPGRVLLAEDLTGKGHITRALTADWTAAFVQVEE